METLGMADDLKENGKWKAPTLAENMKGMEVDSDDEDDDEHDDQQTEDGKICETDNDVIDDDLLKDLDKLHDMKVIDDSVKKKANNHLLSKRKQPTADIGIPLYNKPEDIATKIHLYL